MTDELTYYSPDAAKKIAELIYEEEEKLLRAQHMFEQHEKVGSEIGTQIADIEYEKEERSLTKQEETDLEKFNNSLREQKSKRFAARRDLNRAETKLRAFKEALALILLERECQDGQPHPTPDVDLYLKMHRQASAA